MSKVTSKLQVTIPKRIALRYGISPGDEVSWEEAGEVIRLRRSEQHEAPPQNREARLARFDRATSRQLERQRGHNPPAAPDRGWTRESLYDRGRPR